MDNASDELRFDIDLSNRILNTNKGKILSVNLSKKSLLNLFEVLSEEYKEDELWN